MRNPFASDGSWLRCALHAHSTNSDGELPPRLLARHYERAGFDVLAITDHHVRTVEPSTERLLVVAGTELDAALDDGRDAHVLGLGVAGDPWPRGERADLADVATWIRGSGGIAYLAHSYWSGLRAGDFETCEGLLGLEVYNAGCELEVGRGLASLHWDEVLETGRLLFGLAADDSHHPGYDSAFAWVWARVAERTQEAVVAALRDGCFYSSTGPRILELEADEEGVEVLTTPVRRMTLVAGPKRGASVHAGRLGYASRARIVATNDGDEIVAARLERPPGTPYGRLEVEDGQGRVAWTNPLWI